MKVPEYWLIHEFAELPVGSYVKPISHNHIAKDLGFKKCEGYLLCYTNKGIMEIPEKYVQQVPWYYR